MATKDKAQGTPATGTADEGAGDDTPNYVTAADLDAKLNAVVTSHTKRLEGSLAKKLEALLASAIPKPAEPDPEENDIKGQLKALQAQLASERKAREDAERRGEEERKSRQRDEEHNALSSALRDAGITNPVQVKAAQALLLTEGRVTRTEDGKVAFKVVDKYGAENLVDLAAGVGSWAKEDGKYFLPPKDVKGSGGGTAKTPAGKLSDPKAAQAAKQDAAAHDLVAAILGLPKAE